MTADGRRVRTALVHDWLTGMRGGEKVLEAIAELFPDSPIYTLFHFPGSVSPALESHPIVTSRLMRRPGLRRFYRGYLPSFPRAIESFDLSEFDLVISSSHCVAKGARPRPGAAHLCYCHTPMRYAWDQRQAYFGHQPWPLRQAYRPVLAWLRRWDRRTAGRVDRFLANSSFVAGRIERYYGRRAEVLPPPVDTDFFTPDGGGRESFALMVAAPAPYKRTDLALEACARRGIELRVVGTGPENRRLAGLAARHGTRVRFLGRVPCEELRRIYRRAGCLLQPGVEDFGISTVEALACGCPVVALGRGGVRDIVVDGVHGVLADQPGAGPLAAAIDKCREMDFNELNLRKRAEAFSKARFQQRLREILDPYITPEGSDA